MRSLSHASAIALLSTGDELVSGDLLNTNAQRFAKRLETLRYYVRTHVSVRDHVHDMTQTLKWLLNQHKIIIITGGLGPTQDDVTRQAVSDALGLPLAFHEDVWQRIQAKFAAWQRPCSAINRRQAYFIQGATVLPNDIGTADASWVRTEQHVVIMLPGPPKECMPLFEEHVLAYLKGMNMQQAFYRHTWLLLGQGESQIANDLEALCDKKQLELAYRASFPYLEIKIFTPDAHPSLTEIDAMLAPWCVAHDNIPMSEKFLAFLRTTNKPLQLATHDAQHLVAWLPDSAKHLQPKDQTHAAETITVRYQEYNRQLITQWRGQTACVVCNLPSKSSLPIFSREWLSWKWFQWMA